MKLVNHIKIECKGITFLVSRAYLIDLYVGNYLYVNNYHRTSSYRVASVGLSVGGYIYGDIRDIQPPKPEYYYISTKSPQEYKVLVKCNPNNVDFNSSREKILPTPKTIEYIERIDKAFYSDEFKTIAIKKIKEIVEPITNKEELTRFCMYGSTEEIDGTVKPNEVFLRPSKTIVTAPSNDKNLITIRIYSVDSKTNVRENSCRCLDYNNNYVNGKPYLSYTSLVPILGDMYLNLLRIKSNEESDTIYLSCKGLEPTRGEKTNASRVSTSTGKKVLVINREVLARIDSQLDDLFELSLHQDKQDLTLTNQIEKIKDSIVVVKSGDTSLSNSEYKSLMEYICEIFKINKSINILEEENQNILQKELDAIDSVAKTNNTIVFFSNTSSSIKARIEKREYSNIKYFSTTIPSKICNIKEAVEYTPTLISNELDKKQLNKFKSLGLNIYKDNKREYSLVVMIDFILNFLTLLDNESNKDIERYKILASIYRLLIIPYYNASTKIAIQGAIDMYIDKYISIK